MNLTAQMNISYISCSNGTQVMFIKEVGNLWVKNIIENFLIKKIVMKG